MTSQFVDWRTETRYYPDNLNEMTQIVAVLNVEHILSADIWQMCAAGQTLRQEIDVHFRWG